MTETPTSTPCQIDTAPPVKDQDRALAELRSLKIQGAFIKGDGRRISSKYGISYSALMQAYHRSNVKDTGGAVGRSPIPPNKRSSNQTNLDVDVHAIFRETFIFSPDLIPKLPYHGGRIGWYGWTLKELGNHVSLQAWSSGRIRVYDKTCAWEDVLRIKLNGCGWPEEATDAVLKSLKLNDDNIHLAIKAPGIAPGLHKTIKDDLVKITAETDTSPYPDGTLELKLELRTPKLEAVADEIRRIPESVTNGLKVYLGSMTTMQILTQMQAEIAQLRMAMYSGAPAGSLPEGSNASNGAPPPIAGSNPAGSGPAVQGILSPGVVYRRCPHLSQEGTMMRCEKTRPRLHVGDIEGYPANPVIIPKEEFFRNEKFVCRADFRSCPYFQGRSG